eukprot:9101965-Karenia_brevis.AAC.1
MKKARFATPVSKIALPRGFDNFEKAVNKGWPTKDLSIKITIRKKTKNPLFLNGFCFPGFENTLITPVLRHFLKHHSDDDREHPFVQQQQH